MGHGTADQVLAYKYGKLSADYLTSGLKLKTASEEDAVPTGLTFKTYNGLTHSVDAEELDDVTNWLQKVLPQ